MWKKDGNRYFTIFDDNLLCLKETYITKGNGKKRKIFIANKSTKKFYRRLLPYLNQQYNDHRENANNVHGFMKNKSSITNVNEHRRLIEANLQTRSCSAVENTTVSVDIEDFFPSIKPSMIKGVDNKTLSILFVDDELPQGLPTSPIISNIAMMDIDRQINKNLLVLSKKRSFEFVYTRYADDISITVQPLNSEQYCKEYISRIEKDIFQVLEGILFCSGFTLNKKKTSINRFTDVTNITGVNIYGDQLSVSRKMKRNLRSAFHQKNLDSIVGMIGWVEMVNDQN
jgi:hypothetical protein